MFFRHKKSAIAVLIAVLAIGGVAFAYFTSTGTGSGSASVGSATTVALSGSPVGSLYPGGADLPVTITIHNPGTGSQHVGAISGVVTTQGTCLGSWFVVDSLTTYDHTFTKNGTAGDTGTTSTNVRMTDSGTNQDACQGLTMAIVWSSAA
jgi:hypothetical protein